MHPAIYCIAGACYLLRNRKPKRNRRSTHRRSARRQAQQQYATMATGSVSRMVPYSAYVAAGSPSSSPVFAADTCPDDQVLTQFPDGTWHCWYR